MRLRVLLLLAVAACSAGAPDVRSPVTAPARFSAGGNARLPDRWWLSFGDPALARLIAQGLAQNPGLLATWSRLDQANAAARKAGAARYPTLDASAGAGLTKRRGEGETTSLSLGLAAGYEIDLWGRIDATHDAAELDARASEMDLRAAAISLSAEIATTWYDLVAAWAQEELLDQQRELAERTLDLTRQRFERGLVAEVDVLRQEQNVESIRGERSQAHESAALLQHQLAVLLGRAPTEDVATRTTRLVTLPPLPAAGVPAELMARRPDVAAALLRVQSADRSVAAAIAARYPRIDLGASLSAAAERPHALLESWAASLVGNLVAPLFDGGQRKADVQRARAVLSERVQNYAEAILGALREVEDALVSETEQRAQLASLDRQLGFARDALTRIQAAYDAGMRDYYEVLSAMESVQGLERQRLQAELSLVHTRIALCRALAGSWTLARPRAVL